MRLLVTGGCGFIGSNFIRLVLQERPDWSVINLDSLAYAGNPQNLSDISSNNRYLFEKGDICDERLVRSLARKIDVVINFAAESHVDRSIEDGRCFVRTNVQGTQSLLEAARAVGIKRFVQVSTDEVYGSLPLDRPDLRFDEQSPIAPSSPYAASKAAADHLVSAYQHTYGLNTVITRCSNNFGPYQYPEKVIPLFITNLTDGLSVPLYGDGLNVRDWIHVLDHCAALIAAIERGVSGEIYNIGADNERSNLELTRALLDHFEVPDSFIRKVPDRLGHDLRYAIDSSKARRELGWQPTRSRWPDGLSQTTRWYAENEDWWRPLVGRPRGDRDASSRTAA
jgi:dTDP-glucose 4,6-dehydratase